MFRRRWILPRKPPAEQQGGFDRDSLSNLENADPELCIRLLRTPTVQNYSGLKKKLEHCDAEWMQDFLQLDGLGVLFECLDRLSDRGFSSFTNAYIQLECVGCVRAVMNSRTGLEYIIENREFTRTLAKALDTENTMVKKQVFELLSAICVYSLEGYELAIDALENYKLAKNQRYRFSLIINELRFADVTTYKSTLMAFINCIIVATEDLEDRIRIRNEFIGLQLLDIMTDLRRGDDPDLLIQCEVFDEQKLSDEEELSNPEEIDLGSHIDVFYAIFKKVSYSPQASSFLNILVNLLQLDPTDSFSDVVWDTLDRLVQKATLLERRYQADMLLAQGVREIRWQIENTLALGTDDGGNRTLERPRKNLHSEAQTDLLMKDIEVLMNERKRMGKKTIDLEKVRTMMCQTCGKTGGEMPRSVARETGPVTHRPTEEELYRYNYNELLRIEEELVGQQVHRKAAIPTGAIPTPFTMGEESAEQSGARIGPRPPFPRSIVTDVFPSSTTTVLSIQQADASVPAPPEPSQAVNRMLASFNALMQQYTDSGEEAIPMSSMHVPDRHGAFPPEQYPPVRYPYPAQPNVANAPLSTAPLPQMGAKPYHAAVQYATSGTSMPIQAAMPSQGVPISDKVGDVNARAASSGGNAVVSATHTTSMTQVVPNQAGAEAIQRQGSGGMVPAPYPGTGYSEVIQESRHQASYAETGYTGVPIAAGATLAPASYPSAVASYSSAVASYPSAVASYPSTVAPYQSTVASYPSTVLSYPSTVAPYPSTIAPYLSTVAPYPGTIASYPTTAAPMLYTTTGQVIPSTGIAGTTIVTIASSTLAATVATNAYPISTANALIEGGTYSYTQPPSSQPGTIVVFTAEGQAVVAAETVSPIPTSMSPSPSPPPPGPPPPLLTRNPPQSAPSSPPVPPPPPGRVSIPVAFIDRKEETVHPNVPKPAGKLKHVNWVKIPQHAMSGKNNVWTKIREWEERIEPDFSRAEELFRQTELPTRERKKKQEETKQLLQVNLLEGKRSLNINIYLRQFKCSHEEIIDMVQQGDPEKMGAERLKGLLRLLPQAHEIELLTSYEGDKTKLGAAEKFFLLLLELPSYRLRVEGMVMKEEFSASMAFLKPSIRTIQQACQDLLDNKKLQRLLQLILLTGNFLNFGGYAGNAAGFRLHSLLRLVDTRANKPKMNLMHFVVQEAEEKDPAILTFPDDMKHLEEAARLSMEGLSSEIQQLMTGLHRLHKQLSNSEDDVKEQFQTFVERAMVSVCELQKELGSIKQLARKLAVHFCEDPNCFQLEECLQIFKTFCERVKTAHKENIQRRLQEDMAEKKRREREEFEARRKAMKADAPPPGRFSAPASPTETEAPGMVDNLLEDIRRGFKMKKSPHGKTKTASPARKRDKRSHKRDPSENRERQVDRTQIVPQSLPVQRDRSSSVTSCTTDEDSSISIISQTSESDKSYTSAKDRKRERRSHKRDSSEDRESQSSDQGQGLLHVPRDRSSSITSCTTDEDSLSQSSECEKSYPSPKERAVISPEAMEYVVHQIQKLEITCADEENCQPPQQSQTEKDDAIPQPQKTGKSQEQPPTGDSLVEKPNKNEYVAKKIQADSQPEKTVAQLKGSDNKSQRDITDGKVSEAAQTKSDAKQHMGAKTGPGQKQASQEKVGSAEAMTLQSFAGQPKEASSTTSNVRRPRSRQQVLTELTMGMDTPPAIVTQGKHVDKRGVARPEHVAAQPKRKGSAAQPKSKEKLPEPTVILGEHTSLSRWPTSTSLPRDTKASRRQKRQQAEARAKAEAEGRTRQRHKSAPAERHRHQGSHRTLDSRERQRSVDERVEHHNKKAQRVLAQAESDYNIEQEPEVLQVRSGSSLGLSYTQDGGSIKHPSKGQLLPKSKKQALSLSPTTKQILEKGELPPLPDYASSMSDLPPLPDYIASMGELPPLPDYIDINAMGSLPPLPDYVDLGSVPNLQDSSQFQSDPAQARDRFRSQDSLHTHHDEVDAKCSTLLDPGHAQAKTSPHTQQHPSRGQSIPSHDQGHSRSRPLLDHLHAQAGPHLARSQPRHDTQSRSSRHSRRSRSRRGHPPTHGYARTTLPPQSVSVHAMSQLDQAHYADGTTSAKLDPVRASSHELGRADTEGSASQPQGAQQPKKDQPQRQVGPTRSSSEQFSDLDSRYELHRAATTEHIQGQAEMKSYPIRQSQSTIIDWKLQLPDSEENQPAEQERDGPDSSRDRRDSGSRPSTLSMRERRRSRGWNEDPSPYSLLQEKVQDAKGDVPSDVALAMSLFGPGDQPPPAQKPIEPPPRHRARNACSPPGSPFGLPDVNKIADAITCKQQ
ncbi:INF2 [Branchiostoma lanceolatum]|uniref:INF2 protein n=1 Tax=Branchiostoma lanceolatum TaxID=7740 RepID=A0A8K0A1D4_BRALA|nr:INF2 [Branchiostoma lanceolatum]